MSLCVPCKRRDAKNVVVQMSSLPEHRLTPHLPAFSNTGLDYFRPGGSKNDWPWSTARKKVDLLVHLLVDTSNSLGSRPLHEHGRVFALFFPLLQRERPTVCRLQRQRDKLLSCRNGIKVRVRHLEKPRVDDENIFKL